MNYAATQAPNHALQRTGAAVTPAASAAAFPPPTQRSRQPRRSLSLGSLGVARLLNKMKTIIALLALIFLTACDKAPFERQVFTNLSSGESITLISRSESEVKAGNEITLAEYTRDNGKLRVVTKAFGTAFVRYFTLDQDGLVSTDSGQRFFLPEPLARERQRIQAAEQARQAALAEQERRRNEEAERKRQDEEARKNAITIDNAPSARIKGELYRFYGGSKQGPSRVKRVITLEENDFYVVFADGYGDDWAFRWIANKGTWSTANENGPILNLAKNGDRGHWSGSMIDKSKGNDPIMFTMEFKVE